MDKKLFEQKARSTVVDQNEEWMIGNSAKSDDPNYHKDHIISIDMASNTEYQNAGWTPEAVNHVTNLRYVPKSVNESKGSSSDIELYQRRVALYKNGGYNQLPYEY